MAGTGSDVSATPAGLIAALRVGVDHLAADVAYQVVYETWLARECWQIEHEALPLLVGVEPLRWREHVERHGLARTSQAAVHALIDAFSCAPAAALEPHQLAQWARQHAIALPLPFARVLEFLQQVLPATQEAVVPGGGAATTGDRERVLGAALALVSRFPVACRNADGSVSSDMLAAMIVAQASEWVPKGPPALSHDDIVALIERYLT